MDEFTSAKPWLKKSRTDFFSKLLKESGMKYLIIGNGVAGTTAAQAIRHADPTGEITIITEEPDAFYSRIRLIHFLDGSVPKEKLKLKKDGWYADNKINLRLNTKAETIDAAGKTVSTSDGESIEFDRLLLATGGIPFVPPITGVEKKGVFTLRTLDDALAIIDYAKSLRHYTNSRIVVIGGGLLGLEAANSLIKAGNNVSVTEYFKRLLPRQMDGTGSMILQSQLKKMGFTFYLGAQSKEILGGEKFGGDNVEGLLLKNGRRIDCDMILISAGIHPDMALAKDLGIKTAMGVQVNDKMETEMKGIYAAGDLIEHRGRCYGIWPAAEKQGRVAGTNMAGGDELYEGHTMQTTLKVAGIDLFSAGEIDDEGKHESIVLKDDDRFIYKKLVLKDDVIIGAILYGETKQKMKILKAIQNRTKISGIKKELEDWNFPAT
ncbi:MAG: FAD-dependent oxidoreductase [Nitrospinota bacterium]